MTHAQMSRIRTRRQRRRFGFGLFAVQVGVIVLVAAVTAGIAVFAQIEQVRRDAEGDLGVLARSVATLPVVAQGLRSTDPAAAIQPVTSAMQDAAGVEYISVVDMAGNRVAHPRDDLVGEPVSSDHTAIRAGEEFIGTEKGPMGLTLRAKVPVRDEAGDVIGTVSVGIAQSTIDRDVLGRVAQVTGPTLVAVLVGVVIAGLVTARLRRRLYGLGPDEMLALVQAHQAMTEGVRDGVVGIDVAGRIAVVNSEAQRLLDLPADITGQLAVTVLPEAVRDLGTSTAGRATGQVASGGRTLVVSRSPAVADGRVVGTMLVLQDRSELESMLASLEQERRRAEALRVETHDFDNRMHVVTGLLDLGDLDDARAYLATLPKSQRPGALREWPAIASPPLTALLASLCAQAHSRGVALTVAEDSRVDAPFACGQAEITVVGNLLSNAVEAARGHVEVFLRGDADGLELIVDDDGPGVADDLIDDVFAPGQTSKTIEPWRHGIGLDVVRGHAEERAGTVEVERSALGGARFTVFLPATAETPTRREQEQR